MFDVSTGQSSQVAAHDAPVKGVRFIDQQGGILATGSWDKTLKVNRAHYSLSSWSLTFPSIIVLGPSFTQPNCPSTTGRAVLFHGCCLASRCSGHCRAQDSSVWHVSKSDKSDYREKYYCYAVILLIFFSRLWKAHWNGKQESYLVFKERNSLVYRLSSQVLLSAV